MNSRALSLLAAGLLAASCASHPAPRSDGKPAAARVASAAVTPEAAYRQAADRIYDQWLDLNPSRAVSLGFHQYDGKLSDRSPAAVQKRVAWLKAARTELEQLAPAALSDGARLEREILLTALRGGLFNIEVRRAPQRDLNFYLGELDFLNYITRDWKPLDDRARDVITLCRATPALVAAARGNLDAKLPKTFLQIGLIGVNGQISFLKKDVTEALSKVSTPALVKEVGDAVAVAVAAYGELRDDLEKRKAQATDDFALGEANFLRMLEETEGVHLDLATLEKAGQADLERNLTALKAAAAAFAPGKPLAEALKAAFDDRPAATDVLRVAGEQLVAMRKFVVEHPIASVPSEELAVARESPPFMRFNSAFLRSAGAFEQKPQPSFYFISGPDPTWPAAEQRAYIPSRDRLLAITIHEVWPGHFLDFLDRRNHPSRAARTFGSYATSEGWAHYTEEMMWQEGAMGASPRAHLAQIVEALTRDVRFLSALGLHTRGMTVEQSTQLFLEKAFTDPGTAKQQAVRGTFDPMYLNYTLGKLMILKLRDDWKAKVGPAYSLRAFHDAFLAQGGAPLPVIRAALLGPNAGPPL